MLGRLRRSCEAMLVIADLVIFGNHDGGQGAVAAADDEHVVALR